MNPLSAAIRSSVRLSAAAALLLCALPLPIVGAAEPELKLKDNDVWVMAGDSITAQRLHTNYIEAFYRTRYPNLHLHFRNSGIGGNRTGNVLQRFDYDVAAWHPSIVSVELGMNDVNGPEEAYISGMKQIIAKIRAIPAQPILISSSPVDDGSLLGDWKSPRCEKLHPFTEALKKLAAEEQVLFVDQYHPLIDVWGQNRRKGAEAAAKKNPVAEAVAAPAAASPAATQPGGTPAAATQPAQPSTPALAPSLIPLGGDTVHPGPVGQYTMAAVILSGLKADHNVSAATLTATGAVVKSDRCKITDVAAGDRKLTFTRLDQAGPWPIRAVGKAAIELVPETLKLSQYLLQVTGLPEGAYRVTINDKPAATVSAKDLEAGWNVASSFEAALAERAETIATLIAKLQSSLNNDWRAASKTKDAEKLAAAQKAIDEVEQEIHTAVQPAPMRFEIAPQ